MRFPKIYSVVDHNNKLRFASVYKVDAEYFVKRLIQRAPKLPRPTIVAQDRKDRNTILDAPYTQ